ncbi:MAG: hypothetical protein WD360_04650 [Nitriliruptoraceae bacterium]
MFLEDDSCAAGQLNLRASVVDRSVPWRETGELDRIIAALRAHAEHRHGDVDELEVDRAPIDRYRFPSQ